MPLQLLLHRHLCLALHSSAAVSLFSPSLTKWRRETAAVHPRLSQPSGAGHGARQNSDGSITWWWQCFEVTRSRIRTTARENIPQTVESHRRLAAALFSGHVCVCVCTRLDMATVERENHSAAAGPCMPNEDTVSVCGDIRPDQPDVPAFGLANGPPVALE